MSILIAALGARWAAPSAGVTGTSLYRVPSAQGDSGAAMNAQLFRNGEFFAEVIICGMHRNGRWEVINGQYEWVGNASGSWFRFTLRGRVELVTDAYALYLPSGEVFTLGPLNVECGDPELPSIQAPVGAVG